MRESGVEPTAVLVGHPVAHSLSPDIFEILAQTSAKSFCYELRDVAPGQLGSAVADLLTVPGLVGVNVTVPYKERILAHVSGVSDDVATIGAANTLVRTAEGFVAHNTDVVGFAMMLDYLGLQLDEARVLVLGAGGAARAVVSSLFDRGVRQVLVFNRSSERLQRICDLDVKRIVPYHRSDSSEKLDLVVHCTSLGLEDTDRDIIERVLGPVLQAYPGVPAVDLVYGSKIVDTLFMQTARQYGLKPLSDGLPMLIGQAMEAWQLWTSQTVNFRDLPRILDVLRK